MSGASSLVGPDTAGYHGVLLLPVATTEERCSDWEPGPLPLALRSGLTTDAAARSTYFDRRATALLYRHRWHQDGVQHLVGDTLHVHAYELSAPADERSAWLAIHWYAADDPIAELYRIASLKRPSSEHRPPIDDFITDHIPDVEGSGASIARLFSITYAEEPPDGPPTTWLATRRRLFDLAAATPPSESAVPDAQLRAMDDQHLQLSTDWSALVLRNGAAFLTPASRKEVPFLRDGLVYVRSIYTDVFLMALLQLTTLNDLVDDLRDLEDPVSNLQELLEFERRFSMFRNDLWWQHLGRHGVGDDLLAAFLRQHRLPSLVAQVADELRDHSRQAELRGALQQQVEAQKEDRHRRRIDLAVAAIGVLAVPPALASGVLDLLPDGWWATKPVAAAVWVVTLIGAAFAAMVLLRKESAIQRQETS